LTNFSFLRNLHNSLSRNSERAELDLALMDAATTKRKGGKGSSEEDESFHFIAYVPVDGLVWELDGMRRQPVQLGIFSVEIVDSRGIFRRPVVTSRQASDTGTNRTVQSFRY
jgi:hypothetical protein